MSSRFSTIGAVGQALSPARHFVHRRPIKVLVFAFVAGSLFAGSVWDGVYTEEQSKRGQALYAKECAACHGTELSGGEEAPPLSGGAFMSNWSGLTVGELFERVRLSMPEGRPGTLSRQQNADIVAYMLSFNQFPAGKTELAKDTDVLKQIRFEAQKK
jgi:mono/diheme cytochrome c family protein